MRKLFTLVLLGAVFAGAWYAARWWRHREDLHATLVFSDAGSIGPGARLVHESLVIGQVTGKTRLDDSDALSIEVQAEHRALLLRDSMITIDGGMLIVDNTLAVGRKAEDGDVLRIRDDTVRRWLAKQGERLSPLVEKVREMAAKHEIDSFPALERTLDEWKAEVKAGAPKWKAEGKVEAERRISELDGSVKKLEDALRKRGREDDARKLREKYESLLMELRAER